LIISSAAAAALPPADLALEACAPALLGLAALFFASLALVLVTLLFSSPLGFVAVFARGFDVLALALVAGLLSFSSLAVGAGLVRPLVRTERVDAIFGGGLLRVGGGLVEGLLREGVGLDEAQPSVFVV